MGAPPEYAIGEVIANKYIVEGPLGDSPSGRSYLANAGLGSPKLVVKIYRPDLSSRLISAPDFFLKAGVATEIEHDNLAVCLDIQEEMGQVFSARAHVEGLDFEAWAGKHRWDANFFTRGLELLWQACQGLTALHERTRHLNIHPGNVLVSPLMAKLADWDPRSLGSMELISEALPCRPQYAGYRAPEMTAKGSFLSYPSTDLYAVAGLLYRLTVGDHPETRSSQLQAGIRALDRDLADFLTKAMHPRPEERFQDAAAFSDALWELQGAMQRMQERQPKTAPTLAMEPEAATGSRSQRQEATLFGSASDAPSTPAKEDTFFNFFPAEPAPEPAKPSTRQPAKAEDTFFGSSSPENPPGGTLFGDPAPQREEKPSPRQAAARSPSPASDLGGLAGLESPGTLFGSEPAPPPRKSAPRAEAKPAAVSLSSLEKDPLEMGHDKGPGGFTQFGFKGAGDNRTLYSEGDGKAPAQRKLFLALGAAGVLVLILILGGLFVFLRSSAAPDMPAQAEAEVEPEGEDASAPEAVTSEPMPASDPSGIAAEPARPEPASEGPPYAVDEPVASAPDPSPPPKPSPASQEPSRPAASASRGAPRGSPERLEELMAMVQTRKWPSSASDRLQAADELNDFGKVAEANVAYGRAVQAAPISDKQKVAALGGLAATFYSMGMNPQALEAINRILAINPRNGFALKFKEKLE